MYRGPKLNPADDVGICSKDVHRFELVVRLDEVENIVKFGATTEVEMTGERRLRVLEGRAQSRRRCEEFELSPNGLG